MLTQYQHGLLQSALGKSWLTVATYLTFVHLTSGATSSGKTTLAKHLKNCLPNSFTIHQDVRLNYIYSSILSYTAPDTQDFVPVR